MYESVADYILIVLQMVLASATIWAALATRRQARINEQTLRVRLHPRIRANWAIYQRTSSATVEVTIRETAGVETELRQARACVSYTQDGEDMHEPDLEGRLVHGDESTVTVPVEIDFSRAGTRGFGHFAMVELTLTVCAVVVDDPRVWTMVAHIGDDGDGRIVVSPMPSTSQVLNPKLSLRARLTKMGAVWDAFVERCRRLEY